MNKIKLNQNVFDFPMPVTLLGTTIDSNPNFMALGWISRVNANPPLIGIGVGKHHITHECIIKNKTFSINYPTANMLKETDYCGIYSGKKVDKSKLFTLFNGDLENAPMISECSLSFECKVINLVENPTNTFFIGEIINVFSEDKYFDNGKLSIKKMNPMLLTMPDNYYWSVGEKIGNAWKDGKEI